MKITKPLKTSIASGSTRSPGTAGAGSCRVQANSPPFPDHGATESQPLDAEPLPAGATGCLTSDTGKFVVERIVPMQKLQDEYLRWVLMLANGNKAYAARLLQMDRTTFYRSLRRAESRAPRAPLSEPGGQNPAFPDHGATEGAAQ